MTRILLGLAVLLLLSACTSDAGSGVTEGSGDEPDAETFKSQMDTEAKSLLPDLMTRLGGNLNGMQATFYERGGFGLWDYVASGGVGGTDAPTTESLATSADVLEQHDYTVVTDDAKRRVTANKGDISVIVQASRLTGESVGLTIRMSNHGAIQDGDDFAESAPAEDYLAYLQ
jgi:hypothetical protein